MALEGIADAYHIEEIGGMDVLVIDKFTLTGVSLTPQGLREIAAIWDRQRKAEENGASNG